MRKPLLIALLAALPLLGIAGYAAAGGQSDLAKVRDATNAYHDIQAAKDAGYTTELALFGTTTTCISNGAEGAMGIHMVSSVDGELDETHPEALLYEKRNNGSFKLTGVEYILPIGSSPPAPGATRPRLFGQDFDVTDATPFFGTPTFLWTLHVWIWKPNPDPFRGIFAPWNTRVSCD